VNDFTGGFILGCGVFAILGYLQHAAYQYLLSLKADPRNRTAELIRGKFYYIVPEQEYGVMSRVQERWAKS
jgi:hypothetical protein